MTMTTKPTLIAMMGLPRSGKSTIVAELRNRLGAPVVRRDAIRLALHGKAYLSETEPLIKVLDIYMIKSLFLAGHEVVICDETNYSKEARDHMRSEDWDTVWYEVDTPMEVCLQRAVDTNQSYLIPVITEMMGRYIPLGPEEEILVDVTESGTLVTKKKGGD